MLPAKPMISALVKAEEQITLPDPLTQELIIRYLSSKDFWVKLKIMFENYFGGKEQPIITSERNREILNLTHNYYLKFYDLIWYGWREIKPELNLIFDTDLKNPGDLLQIVLCASAVDWLKNNPVGEAQTLYKAYKAYEIKDEKTLKKWTRRIEKQTGKKIDYVDISTKIISLCVEIGKQSKSKFTKTQALEFEKHEDAKLNFTLKELRKSFR